MLSAKAREVFSKYYLEVDLLLFEDIRLRFRKSFKHFVNKGLRKWKVNVYDLLSTELFSHFRLVYKKVSGQVTQKIES